MYFTRLSMLRPKVIAAASKRWDKSEVAPKHVSRVLDVKNNEICYIAGTAFIDMPLKPNILDEVTQEHFIVVPPPQEKYISEKDVVVLEDESGRVNLVGEILQRTLLITGIVIAVLGCENANGDFEVIDICYPELSPQIEKPIIGQNAYVAIASGLSVGEDKLNLELDLLADFLSGELGGTDEQGMASSITRFILAGNSLQRPQVSEEDRRGGRGRAKGEATITVNEPLEAMDSFLASICQNLDVDVMPGDTDPATAWLPQQPMHNALFKTANTYSTFHSVTNPYVADLSGVSVLGTSGQSIDDIYRFTEAEDRLVMAEGTLEWGHIAPTAPDTLYCHPYRDEDPFVIKQRPHVYFIGNQPEFKTSIVRCGGDETRVILVPSFKHTGTMVLLNLRTLDCVPVSFKL
ncbi:DNA polymerase alpha/epsilon subunit B-domain-containing protein [Gaertneriomyces semiglobifer]|nr:DNA polymerase alpha/epsilon subunit B-domain-containing protein [Gaertneriomyces semiglobifer]